MHKGALKIAPLMSRYLFSNRKKFQDKTGKTFYVQSIAGGLVRRIEVGDYIYLTQNPMRSSRWGERARWGDRIVWIIYQPKFQSSQYIGRLHDGSLTSLPGQVQP